MNLELSDWLYVAGPVLLIIAVLMVLKVSYALKSCSPLPATKPGFCLLPKYVVPVPTEGEDIENEVSSRLLKYGFREQRRDAGAIVFTRGSALGDFSIKIAKIVATASLPLSNPVELRIEYGVAFGCAFDTGDLWKFCQELTQKIEATLERPDRVETGNPYQSPEN